MSRCRNPKPLKLDAEESLMFLCRVTGVEFSITLNLRCRTEEDRKRCEDELYRMLSQMTEEARSALFSSTDDDEMEGLFQLWVRISLAHTIKEAEEKEAQV